MLFGIDNYYYHGSVRRYVAMFGSIFSDIHIKRKATDGSEKEETIKVPIRYGNGNMYSKVPQDGSREIHQVSRILPAMSFELENVYKDASRKTNALNRIQSPTFGNPYPQDKTFQFNRIPYNFVFNLIIRTKNTDDMLQIVEQIVPAFDANLSVTIEDTTGVAVEQDIIVVLNDIAISDNYDDEMKSRLIEWKIAFNLHGHLYKKTQSGLIIRQIDLEAGTSIPGMELIETIDNQNPIQSVQQVLADATEALGNIPVPAVPKITRRRKKKEN